MGYEYQPEYQQGQVTPTIIPSGVSYEYAGAISRKQLEYDEVYKTIPVANVPIDTRGRVHIYGRNDMTTWQRMGITWLVFDPDDIIIESHSEFEAWPYTPPGEAHHFITFLGDRFDLDKPGTYFLSVMLLMNPDNPTIVDEYHGSLCTVKEIPLLGKITRKRLEHDGYVDNIPVYNLSLEDTGLVRITGRNDSPTEQDMGVQVLVFDPARNIVEEGSFTKWHSGLNPDDDWEFKGNRFNFDKLGTYTLIVGLLMGSPDSPNVVDSYDGVLCTTTIEVPQEYELIEHTIYPFAYIYDGDVERVMATFKTDPFTPSAWAGRMFADKLEEEARARGGRVLEVKVYVDKTPLLWTDFRIEVIGTPLGEASPMPIWAAILIIALAITAVIVALTLAIKTIVGLFHHYPQLKEVKPGWGKETLIMTIQDSEEYWGRTPTSVDTLESMSEGELRDHLDQMAKEEIPPPAPSVWPWIAAGAAVVGIGVAVAASKKKRG